MLSVGIRKQGYFLVRRNFIYTVCIPIADEEILLPVDGDPQRASRQLHILRNFAIRRDEIDPAILRADEDATVIGNGDALRAGDVCGNGLDVVYRK